MILDDVLNEAYLGKTKELKHMEDLIEKIRKKYGGTGNLHSLNQLFNTTENSKEWQAKNISISYILIKLINYFFII